MIEKCERCDLFRLERRSGFARWGDASERVSSDGNEGESEAELRQRFCREHGHCLSPNGEGRAGSFAHYLCHTCEATRCLRILPGIQPASAEEADMRLVGSQLECRACRAWKRAKKSMNAHGLRRMSED